MSTLENTNPPQLNATEEKITHTTDIPTLHERKKIIMMPEEMSMRYGLDCAALYSLIEKRALKEGYAFFHQPHITLLFGWPRKKIQKVLTQLIGHKLIYRNTWVSPSGKQRHLIPYTQAINYFVNWLNRPRIKDEVKEDYLKNFLLFHYPESKIQLIPMQDPKTTPAYKTEPRVKNDLFMHGPKTTPVCKAQKRPIIRASEDTINITTTTSYLNGEDCGLLAPLDFSTEEGRERIAQEMTKEGANEDEVRKAMQYLSVTRSDKLQAKFSKVHHLPGYLIKGAKEGWLDSAMKPKIVPMPKQSFNKQVELDSKCAHFVTEAFEESGEYGFRAFSSLCCVRAENKSRDLLYGSRGFIQALKDFLMLASKTSLCNDLEDFVKVNQQKGKKDV